jgi:CSLREA domain-containing protein
MIATEREAKGKVLALGFLLVALMAAWLLAAKPAHAATFTVNSTGDAGDATPDGVCDSDPVRAVIRCTLREAIREANAVPGPHTINFNIPSSFPNSCNATTKVCTISPASQLPKITRATTINGYSQPGASVNTATTGTNAVLKIVLDGSNPALFGPSGLPSASGLFVTAPNTTVRGLVINNGFHPGVFFDQETPSDAGRTLEGCFIGTDVSGTTASAIKPLDGVIITAGEGNVIGGNTLAARNLISGNRHFGIELLSNATGNRVEGNLIGTKKDGTTALGNGVTGLRVAHGGSNNTIGGIGAARNTIAYNGDNGVSVQTALGESSVGNRILSNSIFSNGGLGIDLHTASEPAAGGVVTPNDPDDPDTGPNTLQNFPVISSAVTASGGPTTITGGLNSTPDQTFTIQFFSSPAPDPSGFGEGQTFLGQLTNVTTNANGNAFFTFTPNQVVPISWRVTATATGVGGTSEFSRARIVVRPPP